MRVTLFEGCKEGGETITSGVLLLMLRNSIFKLLSKILIDFSILCCRLGGGGGLLEDGTGVPLDGVGVVALKGGGLNIMVGGGNAR
jgi:hypothetical protein